jgi:hypothetical protein
MRHSSEGRRRRAEELSLRYVEKLEAYGVQHDLVTAYRTGYQACLSDMLETQMVLENQIMDLLAEKAQGQVITYSDGPYLKATRPN